MTDPKVSKTISLPISTWSKLLDISAKEGISIPELITISVRKFYEAWEAANRA